MLPLIDSLSFTVAPPIIHTRLDAIVMTRNNPSSLSGLTGAICRKAASPVYPQVGHIFCNLPDSESLEGHPESPDALNVHLNDVCRAMSAGLGALQLKAQPIYRTASLEPINLYHKVIAPVHHSAHTHTHNLNT